MCSFYCCPIDSKVRHKSQVAPSNKLPHLHLPFLLHHNLRLSLVVLDSTDYTDILTLQVFLRLVGEAASLVEHNHGCKWITRVFPSHVDEGRSVAQSPGTVHLSAYCYRFADVDSSLARGEGTGCRGQSLTRGVVFRLLAGTGEPVATGMFFTWLNSFSKQAASNIPASLN